MALMFFHFRDKTVAAKLRTKAEPLLSKQENL
jgi:hypothetical protein